MVEITVGGDTKQRRASGCSHALAVTLFTAHRRFNL